MSAKKLMGAADVFGMLTSFIIACQKSGHI